MTDVQTQSAPLRVPRAAWQDIVSDVCERRGVTLAQLQSDSRVLHITHARWEAWYLMRTKLKRGGYPISFPALAAYFLKDHSTVIHGIGRWEKIISSKSRKWKTLGAQWHFMPQRPYLLKLADGREVLGYFRPGPMVEGNKMRLKGKFIGLDPRGNAALRLNKPVAWMHRPWDR